MRCTVVLTHKKKKKKHYFDVFYCYLFIMYSDKDLLIDSDKIYKNKKDYL